MKHLLIYYGWPSVINGATDEEQTVREFSTYDYLVLGAGLEDPTHPEHGKTDLIIHLLPTTRVFGYIDLGVTTTSLSLRQIRRSMRRWRHMGVFGILLDDFGYGFGVTRQRQNRAVRSAHQLGLSVIANCWDVEDAMLGPHLLGLGDFLLMESWPYVDGFEDSKWRERAARFDRLRGVVRIMSVATGSPNRMLAETARARAERWGHHAFGWSDLGYGADGHAPWSLW